MLLFLLLAQLAPPHGTLRVDQFFSPALGVSKHVVIYLPPGYERHPARRYAVAYYLHGIYGNESDWVALAEIDRVEDSLIAAGRAPLILVMPDGDDAFYTNWAVPESREACLADTLLVRRGTTYCTERQDYAGYIATDLVHYVDSTYRTLANRRHRGIAGLSMGGYGAVLLALTHPDLFAAAASHSGVLSPLFAGPHPFSAPAHYATSIDALHATYSWAWANIGHAFGDDTASWYARDPTRLAQQLHAAGGEFPALYLDGGTDDGLTDQSRAFHSALYALGVIHAYAEWPGGHDWRYWRAHVGESLAWLAGRIGR